MRATIINAGNFSVVPKSFLMWRVKRTPDMAFRVFMELEATARLVESEDLLKVVFPPAVSGLKGGIFFHQMDLEILGTQRITEIPDSNRKISEEIAEKTRKFEELKSARKAMESESSILAMVPPSVLHSAMEMELGDSLPMEGCHSGIVRVSMIQSEPLNAWRSETSTAGGPKPWVGSWQ